VSNRKRIVIIGGGFAGLSAAARIEDRHRVTLVDAGSHFEYTPGIHELVSRRKRPSELKISLSKAADELGQAFVNGRVVGLDRDQRRVLLADAEPLEYDALIVACGAAPSAMPAGAADHALPFARIDDALALRRRIKTLTRGSFVTVLGGGDTGVEVLGELLRGFRRGDLRLRIVEASERLMPRARRALGRRLATLAERRDVEVVLGQRVRQVAAGHIELESGVYLPSALTVLALGRRPPAWLTEAGLMPPSAPGARTFDDLVSVVDPNVLIAGDAARPPDAPDRLARVALEMGHRAGANLCRRFSGRQPRAWSFEREPTLLAFGGIAAFLVGEDGYLEDRRFEDGKDLVWEAAMAALELQAGHRPVHRATRRALGQGRRLGSRPPRLGRLPRLW
jgi:NADH:ubiquinone reductase (non-electrogenic)